MLGNPYELIEAADEQPCDYWIQPRTLDDHKDIGEQRFRAFDIVDRKFGIVVEEEANQDAFDAAEAAGYDPYWPGEVQRAEIKEIESYVVNRDAYYVEEEPEKVYENVLERRAERFLGRRGEDWHEIEDSWYYPKRAEAVIVYRKGDEANDYHRVAAQYSDLPQGERDLLLMGIDPDESDDRRTWEETAALIDDEAPIGTRESEILALYLHGTTSHAEMADELEPCRGSIASSAYLLEDKFDQMAWVLLNVVPHLDEEQMSEPVAELAAAVEAGDPRSHDERDVEGETTLR